MTADRGGVQKDLLAHMVEPVYIQIEHTLCQFYAIHLKKTAQVLIIKKDQDRLFVLSFRGTDFPECQLFIIG